MRKPTYQFEILDSHGKTLKRCSQRCNNIDASMQVSSLLAATPNAAAVFGFEKRGRLVQSAYRG